MALTQSDGGTSTSYAARTHRELNAYIGSISYTALSEIRNTWFNTGSQAAQMADLIESKLSTLTADKGWTGPGSDAFIKAITTEVVKPLRDYAERAAGITSAGEQRVGHSAELDSLVERVSSSFGTAITNNIPWDIDNDWKIRRKDVDQSFFGKIDELVTGDDEAYEKAKSNAPYEIVNGSGQVVREVPKEQFEPVERSVPANPSSPVYPRTDTVVANDVDRFDRIMQGLDIGNSPRSAVQGAAVSVDAALAAYAPVSEQSASSSNPGLGDRRDNSSPGTGTGGSGTPGVGGTGGGGGYGTPGVGGSGGGGGSTPGVGNPGSPTVIADPPRNDYSVGGVPGNNVDPAVDDFGSNRPTSYSPTGPIGPVGDLITGSPGDHLNPGIGQWPGSDSTSTLTPTGVGDAGTVGAGAAPAPGISGIGGASAPVAGPVNVGATANVAGMGSLAPMGMNPGRPGASFSLGADGRPRVNAGSVSAFAGGAGAGGVGAGAGGAGGVGAGGATVGASGGATVGSGGPGSGGAGGGGVGTSGASGASSAGGGDRSAGGGQGDRSAGGGQAGTGGSAHPAAPMHGARGQNDSDDEDDAELDETWLEEDRSVWGEGNTAPPPEIR